MIEDAAFQADFEKTLDTPVNAITGEKAGGVVDAALEQLFEEYERRVDYLRQMPQQK